MKLLAALTAATLLAAPVAADEYRDNLAAAQEHMLALSGMTTTMSGAIEKSLGSGKASVGSGIFRDTLTVDAGRKVSKLIAECGTWTEAKKTCTFVGEVEVKVRKGGLLGKDSISVDYILFDVSEFTVDGEKVIGDN